MKTALVTGGNRGIGFEICYMLDKLDYQVILCSRDLRKGQKAALSLSKNVIVRQLDVTNETSIQNLYHVVKKEIGKIDILINNAGVGADAQESQIISGIKLKIKNHFRGIYRMAKKVQPYLNKNQLFNENIIAENISLSRVKEIMETNFYGPWGMIQTFIPLLQKGVGARIINISSGLGALNNLSGKYPGYSMSKTSLNALTIMFSNELKNKGIKVNAVCPGWVKTDMGGPDAPGIAREGADTVVWLATAPEIQSGKFYKNRQEIPW